MKSNPTKILLLSELSVEGAKLYSLAAGAIDFLPKNAVKENIFINKVRQLAVIKIGLTDEIYHI